MFRPAARALARAPTVAARTPANRRLISTGPTKSRSWKNTFLRLGLAGGAVYYYNTSSVFSEEPKCMFRRLELGLPLFLDPEVASRDNPVTVKANEVWNRKSLTTLLFGFSLSPFFDPETKWR
jgi:hypothetical protein